MADTADVEVALVSLIAATLYPNGVAAGPTAAAGAALIDIRRGWPTPAMLDIALASGNDVLVRVYPESGMTRNTSRFTLQWRDMAPVPATLAATVVGSAVTFMGTGDPSHVAGVMIGTPPYSRVFAYRLQPGDGPAQVASALEAQIGGSTSAVNGVLTLSTTLPVIARVVNDQGSFMETRRQDQGFRITIWSANNAARDAVASSIDNALANLLDSNGNPTMILVLPDNTAGWLRYRVTYITDGAEKIGLYRRDLCYMVEYPTTITAVTPSVLFPESTLSIETNTPKTQPEILLTPIITLNS